MRSHIKKIAAIILDALFPSQCASCKKEGSFLCAECFEKHTHSGNWYCPHCKKRIPPATDTHCSTNCKKHSKIDAVFSIGYYANPALRELLHIYKFSSVAEIGALLGKKLATELANNNACITTDTLVIPVPLHKKRLRSRGFNQAEVLARHIAEALNLPLLTNILIKTKRTPPQSGIDDHEKRRDNVAGVFTVIKPELIQKKDILLVDDIFTSGATMNECASVLKAAGARNIYGVAVAR